jgi:hypothetical protein
VNAPLRTVVYTRRRTERTDPSAPPTDDAVDEAPDGAAPTTGRPRPRSPLAVASVALPIVAFAYFGFTKYPELQIAVPIVFVLMLVAVRLTRKLNHGRAFDLAGIVLAGFATKFFLVAMRYDSIYGTYSGVGDADKYHEHGARLAAAYRNFDFSEPAERDVPGTGFIRIVTGYVYAIFTDEIAVGFIVYGLFGFIGCYLLYRAFELAMPEGNPKTYAVLIFFWPSMLFWPGSIGKEAWLIMGIGFFAYGAARILTNQAGGLPPAALGTWAIFMTRPHVILLLFMAFACGYALRPGSRFSALGPVGKAVGLALLILPGTLILGASNEFFGIEEFNQESIEAELEETSETTSQGGSKFSTPSPFNPVGYLIALITVLFRPFLFEADSLQMLLTSVEGMILGVMLARSLPQIVKSPALLRRWPYVAASLVYVAAFAFAFSSIGNFGILARQRVQMLPFVFVLLALPRARAALARPAVRPVSGAAAAPVPRPR